MTTKPHEIRPFATMEEYLACLELQEATWGEGFRERVSPAILKVSQILGGVAAGAWNAEGRLDGFVFGMTGPLDGTLVHWSDMLAVRPQLRDSGLGARLKAYQRDQLLAQGVRVMLWTFDPLQSRNAHLNFAKLGIVVREYRRDMYGTSDSPLHRGIGTDRFVATWEMDSDRVVARLNGGEPQEIPETVPVLEALPEEPPGEGPVGLPRPGMPDLSRREGAIRVAIPCDIAAMMEQDMECAREWREATQGVFTHYLDRGWEVREFRRGTPCSEYVLLR